jgi:hypothetical protein
MKKNCFYVLSEIVKNHTKNIFSKKAGYFEPAFVLT